MDITRPSLSPCGGLCLEIYSLQQQVPRGRAPLFPAVVAPWVVVARYVWSLRLYVGGSGSRAILEGLQGQQRSRRLSPAAQGHTFGVSVVRLDRSEGEDVWRAVGAFALVGVLRIYRVRHVERVPAIQWPARSVSATKECYPRPAFALHSRRGA